MKSCARDCIRIAFVLVLLSVPFSGCSSPGSPPDVAGRFDLLVQVGGAGYDSSNDIVARPGGGFVIVGHFNQEATFGRGADVEVRTAAGYPENLLIPDLFCAAYDRDGELEWVRTASSSGHDVAQAVAIGPEGEVYVVGSIGEEAVFDSADGRTETVISHGPEDGFIARYDASGVLDWVFAYGGEAKSTLRDVCLLDNGQVATVGYLAGEARLDDPQGTLVAETAHGGFDAIVVILQADGSILRFFQEGGELDDRAMSIASSGPDGLVVGGAFQKSSTFVGSGEEPWILEAGGDVGMFVCKYTASGEVQWAVSGGGQGLEAQASANGLAVSPEQDVYLTGFYRDDMIFFPGSGAEMELAKRSKHYLFDGYLAKLSADGTPQWALSLGGYSTDMATAVALNSRHEPIVVGFYTQEIEFGDSGQKLNSTDKDLDAFVAGFTASGAIQWARNFVGDGADSVTDLAIPMDDSLLLAGNLSDSVRFSADGEDELVAESRGEADGYAVRLGLGGE